MTTTTDRNRRLAVLLGWRVVESEMPGWYYLRSPDTAAYCGYLGRDHDALWHRLPDFAHDAAACLWAHGVVMRRLAEAGLLGLEFQLLQHNGGFVASYGYLSRDERARIARFVGYGCEELPARVEAMIAALEALERCVASA